MTESTVSHFHHTQLQIAKCIRLQLMIGDHVLFSRSPHYGSSTHEARYRMVFFSISIGGVGISGEGILALKFKVSLTSCIFDAKIFRSC